MKDGSNEGAVRLNSIADLLEHFRQDDDSEDKRTPGSVPIIRSVFRQPSSSSISSSFLSSSTPSHVSDVSSVSSKSSQDSKDSGQGSGQGSPLDHWLSELPSLYESECSVMLQSKSLQGNNCSASHHD